MVSNINLNENNKEIVEFNLSGELSEKDENLINLFLNDPEVKNNLIDNKYKEDKFIENEGNPFESELLFFFQQFTFKYSNDIEKIISVYYDIFEEKILTDFYWSKDNTIKRLNNEYYDITLPKNNEEETPFKSDFFFINISPFSFLKNSINNPRKALYIGSLKHIIFSQYLSPI